MQRGCSSGRIAALLKLSYKVGITYHRIIEYGIFGEGSHISTNQKRENGAFPLLIGRNMRPFPDNTVLYSFVHSLAMGRQGKPGEPMIVSYSANAILKYSLTFIAGLAEYFRSIKGPPKVGSQHFRATNIVLSVQMLCCAKTPCWTSAQHFRAKTQCRTSALHFRATNAVSDLSTAFSCEIAVSDLSTAFSRENAVSDLSTAFSRENAVSDLSTTFSC